MSDPLSAIAGIAGLIDITARTSSQILQLIDDWKDAPRQVHFLAEEINMSQHVSQQLKDLRCVLVRHNVDRLHQYDTALNVQLDRVKPVWAELAEILASVKGPVANKLRKGKWMRKASRVAYLQGKLRDIRFSTLEILGIYNA